MFNNILSRFGIETTCVAQTDVDAWQAAIRPNTRLFFLETPSNPLTEIADIEALSAVAHARGILVAVDNCFCTPILQRPLNWVPIWSHSATKYLDGQGRVLGGAVVGPKRLTDEVFKFLRTAGLTLSAFNAWVLLKGLETLQIRMEAQSARALALAQWLEAHPKVARVFYPACPRIRSTTGHAPAEGRWRHRLVRSARRPQRSLAGRRRVPAARSPPTSATPTTLTHPASTTHGRITAEARAAAGISEGLLRVAVGLEAVVDLEGRPRPRSVANLIVGSRFGRRECINLPSLRDAHFPGRQGIRLPTHGG